MSNKNIELRVQEAAKLMLEKKLTVREIAKELGFSKSTIHRDLVHRLPIFNQREYERVREVLDQHLEDRYLLGGLSTKYKYEKLRRVSQ